MTLTLRVENFDVLDNAGPISIQLSQRGCEAGRGVAMDWVLPDPARRISGQHFSVAFKDGTYWLTDTSMNGTFLQGAPHRLQGAHKIANGDRFVVGHYVIVAQMADGHAGFASPAPVAPVATPFADAESDPWDFGTSDTPVSPMPVVPDPHHLDDVASDFVPAPIPVPVQMPSQDAPPSPPVFQQPQTPQPAAPVAARDDTAVFKAFCDGAELNPDDYADVDVIELVHALGKVMRGSTQEVMSMLQDRAAVKQFTKGGERTMRSATGNNPMKFMPDTVSAIEVMFLKHRDGFMQGPDGFDNALRDIRRHQTAVFAALQPALAALLSGLSPNEIEASVGSGILGSGSRAKFWEAYVAQWDEKAAAGDNGLLDSFLQSFADAYAAAAGKAGA